MPILIYRFVSARRPYYPLSLFVYFFGCLCNCYLLLLCLCMHVFMSFHLCLCWSSVVFLFIFTDVFRLMLTYDFFYVYVCISFHVNSCLSMCVYAFCAYVPQILFDCPWLLWQCKSINLASQDQSLSYRSTNQPRERERERKRKRENYVPQFNLKNKFHSSSQTTRLPV